MDRLYFHLHQLHTHKKTISRYSAFNVEHGNSCLGVTLLLLRKFTKLHFVKSYFIVSRLSPRTIRSCNLWRSVRF